jgi:hypothetical protein
MRKCSYCGRESEDTLERCRECGSELSPPSVVTGPPEQSRWPLVVGLLLGGAGALWLFFVSCARIDSPEEFDMALRQAPAYALPLALGTMCVALDVGRRWTSWLRILAALIICGAVWLLGWQFQAHLYYSQLRNRGVDPEQVLRRSKLRSALPNQRPGVDAGWPVLFAFQRAWPRATQAERWAAHRVWPSQSF